LTSCLLQLKKKIFGTTHVAASLNNLGALYQDEGRYDKFRVWRKDLQRSWAKKHVAVGTKRISLAQLRKVLGLESVKDAAGNIIQEAPLPVWANLRQRALNVAIAEINAKTGLTIALESLERSNHRRVTTGLLRSGLKRCRTGIQKARVNSEHLLCFAYLVRFQTR
jgi:Initiator Replication protein